MGIGLNFADVLSVLGAIGAVVVAVLGAIWVLIKVIAAQQDKLLTARFAALTTAVDGIKTGMARDQEITQRLERELLTFKAELPREYVRRDDFIRAVGTIEAKIDNMALRVERVLLNNRGE